MQTKKYWKLDSYKEKQNQQKIVFNDEAQLEKVLNFLNQQEPLVDYNEIIQLKEDLKKAEKNNFFILQMGDCAEKFSECDKIMIDMKIYQINLIANIIKQKMGVDVIKIGRIAGQYAKPRSQNYEIIDQKQVLSYRGDLINGLNEDNRIPDCNRLIQAFQYSKDTIQFMNTKNTFVNDKRILFQNQDQEKIYNQAVESLDLQNQKVYTSHEGLLLEYEQSLTHTHDSKFYCQSAHLIWIGFRTNQLQNAHIEFFKGIENPIGVKIGPNINYDDFVLLNQTINPENQQGKIIIILRLGSQNVQKILPILINAKLKHKLNFIWMLDPMHANTFQTENLKTRDLNEIWKEIHIVQEILLKKNQKLQGIHLETSPKDVTECLGGNFQQVKPENLIEKYETACDPRLNFSQTIETIFQLNGQIIFK